MATPSNPDFSIIEERILTNVYDKDKGVEILLNLKTDEEEKAFSLYLKVKSVDVNIEFDTRVAIERHHKSHKHNEIHIQGDIKKTTLEFFKNGELHILLDVVDEKQLLIACQGFTYTIVNILLVIEEKLGYAKNTLVSHFFAEDITDFEDDVNELHGLVFNALNSNKIELKAKKSKDYSQVTLIKKMFILMLLFYDIPMLQPILKAPVYRTFCQIPEIRRLKLTQAQHKSNIENMIEKKYTIEKFTHEKYIGEISK